MNPAYITIILYTIAIGSLFCCLILWKLLTTQKRKAEQTYQAHKQEHDDLLFVANAKRNELRLVLNAFDDALVITDSSGIIQIANESARKLCQGRKLLGNTVSSAFLNDQICKHINSSIQKKEANKHKVILNNSSFGQNESVENSAWIIDYATLPSQNGSQQNSLHSIIIRDISTEHRTDQVKREFVANASHELRTPLAIISGYIENLIDDDVVDSPTTARRILTTMRKHSERIALLIEEMLIISKLESGTTAQLKHQPFELNQTIDDIVERLDPVIQNQHAAVTTSFIPDTFIIKGDAFYWDQALYNIIENALKQNAESPINIHITASINPQTQELSITITDNGKGIPSDHLPYIFNRFYRVQKHHSQNEVKGTGLGLSIVKHAIEAHGGNITASSKPGIETTFTITCPIE